MPWWEKQQFLNELESDVRAFISSRQELREIETTKYEFLEVKLFWQ